MKPLFPTFEALMNSGFIFRIQDHGPSVADRITVVFCDGDYLGLDLTARSFSQWGEGIDIQGLHGRMEEGTAVDLTLGDLSPELQQHILYRVNEGWSDFLQRIIDKDPDAVAASRVEAGINEGTTNCSGEGIYQSPDGYRIRIDGIGPDDDRGPYDTPEEALQATLPDNYSLSGPEYHPDVDPNSLEPTPNLAELRAKAFGESED